MKKIVVPIDFSETSINALYFAIKMCREITAEITLFHAVDYPIPAGAEFGMIGGNVIGDQLQANVKNAEERLLALIKTLPNENTSFKVATEMGSLLYWVNNFLPALVCDLLVMGTTGASDLKEVFIGSNTENVVRFAKCPVLAVPKKAKCIPIRSIVVPFEIDEMPDQFISSLKEMQLFSQATIQLVWVKTPHSLINEEEVIEEMAQCVHKHGIQDFRINTRRAFSPAEGIINFVDEMRSELIAMPTHGRKGLKHLFLDSVTEAVVNKTEIPVWTFNKEITEQLKAKVK